MQELSKFFLDNSYLVAYAVLMKDITGPMKTLPRKSKIRHYKPNGSYELVLPIGWCENSGVDRDDLVKFHEFVDHPRYLLIELVSND